MSSSSVHFHKLYILCARHNAFCVNEILVNRSAFSAKILAHILHKNIWEVSSKIVLRLNIPEINSSCHIQEINSFLLIYEVSVSLGNGEAAM